MTLLNWMAQHPLTSFFYVGILIGFISSLAIKASKTLILCVWLWRNPGTPQPVFSGDKKEEKDEFLPAIPRSPAARSRYDS